MEDIKDLLEEIKQRNKSVMKHINEGIPEVGIFWIMPNKRLLVSSIPWKDGEVVTDRYINGPNDHYNFWTVLQRNHQLPQDLEYDQIPRGRVILDKSTKIYHIYIPSKLMKNQKLKDQIIAEFKLFGTKYEFNTDEHYEM